jgi:hypothetical protein
LARAARVLPLRKPSGRHGGDGRAALSVSQPPSGGKRRRRGGRPLPPSGQSAPVPARPAGYPVLTPASRQLPRTGPSPLARLARFLLKFVLKLCSFQGFPPNSAAGLYVLPGGQSFSLQRSPGRP